MTPLLVSQGVVGGGGELLNLVLACCHNRLCFVLLYLM